MLYIKYTVLLVFSLVFTVFSLQKHVLLVHVTCIYQNTHEPYIQHEMQSFASVFMCFHYVFTKEKVTFGKFYMYTKIHMNHVFFMKYRVLLVFSCVYNVFSLQKHVFFGKYHMYTKIHMNFIFYIKCTVLLVFSCVFTVFSLQKHVLLVHVTCIYQNTHVPYILHKIHSFASVFMCFYCDFTAETCTFGTFHMFIPKYT
jgi:hypothetical protein